jgi:hypothetical protein
MLVSAVGWVIRHLNLTNYLEAILLDLILAAYRNDWRNWVRSYLLVEILSHLRPMEEDLDFVLVGVLDTPFHQFLQGGYQPTTVAKGWPVGWLTNQPTGSLLT